MKTVVTRSAAEAASFIRSGELAAFPTETVYGLGANALDRIAVEKIFVAKDRPPDNPLIVHVGSKADVSRVAREITPLAERLIEAFFPGPLTVVLPRSDCVPDIVTAGLDTVGVRMPRHPLAIELLAESSVPLCAPSANRSGRPSPTTWEAVLDDMDGRIACVLQGEPTEIGLESTVVDATGGDIVLLRAGGLAIEELERIAPVRFSPDTGGVGEVPMSPGLKYRHYAPAARVVPIDHASEAQVASDAAFIGMRAPCDSGSFRICRTFTDVSDYARELFAFFRECDVQGVTTIWAELPPPAGIGAALRDRIVRASRG